MKLFEIQIVMESGRQISYALYFWTLNEAMEYGYFMHPGHKINVYDGSL